MESISHKGNRPELVGGGVVRSYGGWSAVLSLRKSEEGVTGDRRILGMGEFVERVVNESEEGLRQKLSPAERRKRSDGIFKEECEEGKIPLEYLRMGNRRGETPRVHSKIARRLTSELEISLAEVARLSGVSTSAISKVIQRSTQGSQESFHSVNNVPPPPPLEHRAEYAKHLLLFSRCFRPALRRIPKTPKNKAGSRKKS